LFEQSTVEDSEALRLQAAADYWRQWYYAFDEAQLSALLPSVSTRQQLRRRQTSQMFQIKQQLSMLSTQLHLLLSQVQQQLSIKRVLK
jgi:hypothetical protein